MKKLILLFTSALVGVNAPAALPEPDLVARIHFAGGNQVAADKNYPAFRQQFSSPEALALRQQVADKLAPWLAAWLAAPAEAARLRPLLDDLQSAEWRLEARAGTGQRVNLALAVKLPAARAAVWQQNFKAIFSDAKTESITGWLLLETGTGPANCTASLRERISAPSTNWLTAEISWPRLAEWLPAAKALALPQMNYRVNADATNLLIRGQWLYPAPLNLKLEPWRFPTNTVHQPFVSFTAVRGFGDWFKTQPWAQPFLIQSSQNQAFIWAMAGAPFMTFCAVPVPDAIKALDQFQASLTPRLERGNVNFDYAMIMNLERTNNSLTLVGAPMVAPYVKAVKEPGGEFLLAGGFPNTPRSKPLPPELFQRLAPPNLVFYHWEITAERYAGLLQSSQLALLLTRNKQVDGESVPFKWLASVVTNLGNQVTEITQTAPDQLTFSRRAPGGLTAFEFLALINWLDAPKFPSAEIKLPPPNERLKQNRARQLKNQSHSALPAPAFPAPRTP